ncbi:MAG TPA: hypothetical protein VIC28_06365, partial [Thermoanaerobaculia bacterium]
EPINNTGLMRYGMLRRLFVLGYSMNIVLWFVPAFRMKVGGDLGFGAEDKVFSMLSMVRLISQTSPGWTLFFVVTFASNIVFLVLAFAYPKRWLFIIGASIAAPFMLWGFFSGENPDIHQFLVPRLLGYVATALTLIGFFIRPPVQA